MGGPNIMNGVSPTKMKALHISSATKKTPATLSPRLAAQPSFFTPNSPVTPTTMTLSSTRRTIGRTPPLSPSPYRRASSNFLMHSHPTTMASTISIKPKKDIRALWNSKLPSTTVGGRNCMNGPTRRAVGTAPTKAKTWHRAPISCMSRQKGQMEGNTTSNAMLTC